MLGLGLSFAKQTAKVFGYIKDSLKTYFRFYDTTPDFLLDGSTSFDGTNDYISIADDNSLDITSSWSISTWIKIDSGMSSYHRIIGKQDPSSNQCNYGIGIATTNKVGAIFNDGSWRTAYSTDALVVGQWYHIVGVWDDSEENLHTYIDGSLIATTNVSGGSPSGNDDPITIGMHESTGGEYFAGKIANVGLWSRALSASEIESIYWRGSYSELKDTELTNLVSWWDLSESVENNYLIEDEVSPSYSFGSELVSNGGFDSSTTGWNTTNCTIDSVSGGQDGNCFEITRTGGSAQQSAQGLGTVATVGNLYKLSFYVKSGTSGNESYYVRIWDGSNYIINKTGTTSSSWVEDTGVFMAETTTITIEIGKDSSSAGTMLFDTVSIKQVTSDGNLGLINGATVNTDSYSGESPFKPRIKDIATPKMAVQLADGSTSLDGSDDYITTGYTSLGTSDYTISFWMKRDSNGEQMIFDNREGNDDGIKVFFRGTNVLTHSNDTVDIDTTATITDTDWHHIAITGDIDGNGVTYIDGSLSASGDISGVGAVSTANDLWIGRRRYESESDYFDGSLANVGIWSTALTQQQVQKLMFTEKYSGLTSDLKTNLVSWYDMGSTIIGAEKFTDTDMTGSGWTTETTWAFSGGTLRAVDCGNGQNAYLPTTTVNGQYYRLSFTISDYTTGGVSLFVAGHSTTYNTAGDHYYDFYADSTSENVGFKSVGTTTLDITNVSFKAISIEDLQGSNNAEIIGATATTGYTSSPHGVVDPLNYGQLHSGKAVSFDGSNDYIGIDSSSSIEIAGDISISCWINADNFTDTAGLVVKRTSGISGVYQLDHTTGGAIRIFTGGDTIASTTTISTGRWYHIVATVDSGVTNGTKIYIDGVQDATTGTCTVSSSDSQNLRIGSNEADHANGYFAGDISGVKIFNTVLTQAQIQELYTKPETVLPTGVSASNLKLDLPMQEGTGSYVYDGSGNQNHGTITGATWATGAKDGYQSSLVRSNTPMIFDDSDDYVNINTTAHQVDSGTISGWFFLDTVSGNQTLFSVGTASVGVVRALYANGANLKFIGYSADWDSTVDLSAKTWYHLLLTWNGTSAVVYVNGTAYSTTQSNLTTPDGTVLKIGTATWKSGDYLGGNINEVAIWDTALDADAVTALYNSGTPLDPTSDSGNYDNSDDLQGYWRNDGISTWTDRANTGVASFDGTNDYLELGSDIVITDDEWTLTGWYKFDSFTDYPHLFSNSSTTAQYIRVKNDGSEIYLETDSNGDDATLVLTSAFSTGRWYHIAITRNNETWGGYIDGVFKAFYDGTSGDNSLTIDRLGGARFFDGQMAGVHIFDTVLSSSEVTELYNIDKRSSISGHSQFSNCKGSWLMGAGTGDTTSTIQDQTSENNDATVNGASLVGYTDGTGSGSPVSIVIPEGSTSGRDNQGFLLSDTTSITNGIRFDGSSTILKVCDSVPVTGKLQSLGEFLTVECWFKAKAITANDTGSYISSYTIAELRTETASSTKIPFNLGINNSKATFGATHDHTTSDERIDGTTTLSVDTWYHYAVTINGDAYVQYLNGSADKSGTLSTATGDRSVGTTNSNLFIGARSDNSGGGASYFNGYIDEFRVYDKTLSASEILKNYNNGKASHS